MRYASSIKAGDKLAADAFFDIEECTVLLAIREGWHVFILTDDPNYPDGWHYRPIDKLKVLS